MQSGWFVKRLLISQSSLHKTDLMPIIHRVFGARGVEATLLSKWKKTAQV